MFYLAVEEYMMPIRQRELEKVLEFKQLLRDSLESRPEKGLRFPTKAVDWLRNLETVFEAGVGESVDDRTTADYAVC